MNETRRRAAAHAFVSALEAPVLEPSDAHHLARVLRLAVGEVVTVSDGAGRWRTCTHCGDGALEALGAIEAEAAPQPPITIAFAVMKGDRPEWVVQKLTELGVDRIVPLHTARSVVRWDAPRAARHVERWRRVAREAAMQCRRVWLPVVEDLANFAEVAARPGACVAEPGGQRLSLDHPVVLVGPEGGFTAEELSAASLTIRITDAAILRADTASVAAAVMLSTLREDLAEKLDHR